MKQYEVTFAGFGGQGIMTAGQLLAYSGMNEGKMTWELLEPSTRHLTLPCFTFLHFKLKFLGGRVLAVKQDMAKIVLISPVCTSKGERLALSRRIDKHWRLIGWAKLMRGKTTK